MTHKAEYKWHYLAYDWQVSGKEEEEKVVDGVTLIVFVHPFHEIWTDDLDTIEDGSECERNREQDGRRDHKTAILFVERREMPFQLGEQDNAKNDEYERQDGEGPLREDFQILVHFVIVLVLVFEMVQAPVEKVAHIEEEIEYNEPYSRIVKHLLLHSELQ